jgi:hypothetical protein
MRAALSLTDPALIFLDRVAMARQAGPIGSGSIRPTLEGVRADRVDSIDRRLGTSRLLPTTPPWRSPGWDDVSIGIRGNGIEQLDLDPDDRTDPGLLGRPSETDDAVEPQVFGRGEARQAELERPLDELVGRRGAVEKREVGVAVKLGVRCHRGLLMIEQMFCYDHRNSSCMDPKISSKHRNKNGPSGVSTAMRAHRRLVTSTARTAVMVGLATLLILVLLPAMLTALAASS